MKVLAVVPIGVVLAILAFSNLTFVPAPAPIAVDNEVSSSDSSPIADVRFRLDPARSKFICHANRAGLAWFKGKSHWIGVKDFDGEASMSLDSISPASLTMTIRAASLEETRPVFTDE